MKRRSQLTICLIILVTAGLAGCTAELPDGEALLGTETWPETCSADQDECGDASFVATLYYFPLRDGQVDQALAQEWVELIVDGWVAQVYSEGNDGCSGSVVYPAEFPGEPHTYTVHPVDELQRQEDLETWSGNPADASFVRPALVSIDQVPVGSETTRVWNHIVVYGEPGAFTAEILSEEELGSFQPPWLPHSLVCEP